MVKISGVTITYNEEKHIGSCLSSMQAVVDELVVVDSYSTDRTLEIARELGARIIQHPFEGYLEQKRFAIGQANYDRVLFLDGDELLSPELTNAIARVKADWDRDCYLINRLNNIAGQWIRHGGWYPDRKYRLFDRRKITSVGTNPHDRFYPLKGASRGRLSGDILHFTNEDLADRMLTVNRLSTSAARAFHNKGKRGAWWRLIVKPRYRFLQEYFWRLGFLDGFYGYLIAKSSAQYVFLREAKLLELGRSSRKK